MNTGLSLLQAWQSGPPEPGLLDVPQTADAAYYMRTLVGTGATKFIVLKLGKA